MSLTCDVGGSVGPADIQMDVPMSPSKETPKVRVMARVRPARGDELTNGNRHIIQVESDSSLVFEPSKNTQSMRIPGSGMSHKNELFAFDHVFGESATQLEVFQRAVQPLIAEVLNGYSCTVFAYGATGSGKTHTLTGHRNCDPGLIFHAVHELFKAVEERKILTGQTIPIRTSFLEIYNENIRDLIPDPARPPPKVLSVCEKEGVSTVLGLSDHIVYTPEELLDLFENGLKKRVQFATNANATSSRSHAVLTILVGDAKLSFIDLAGSERAASTTNRGDRIKEGAFINKSLLALGNMMNALANSKSKFVQYRESKLARILKDSLAGNCKTVMIVNISPSSKWRMDTYNTLQYAKRAKEITVKAAPNQPRRATNMTELICENERLKSEVATLRANMAKLLEEKGKERAIWEAEHKTAHAQAEGIQKDIQKRHIERLKVYQTLWRLQDEEESIKSRLAEHAQFIRNFTEQNPLASGMSRPVAITGREEQMDGMGVRLSSLRDRDIPQALAEVETQNNLWAELKRRIPSITTPTFKELLTLALSSKESELNALEAQIQVESQKYKKFVVKNNSFTCPVCSHSGELVESNEPEIITTSCQDSSQSEQEDRQPNNTSVARMSIENEASPARRPSSASAAMYNSPAVTSTFICRGRRSTIIVASPQVNKVQSNSSFVHAASPAGTFTEISFIEYDDSRGMSAGTPEDSSSDSHNTSDDFASPSQALFAAQQTPIPDDTARMSIYFAKGSQAQVLQKNASHSTLILPTPEASSSRRSAAKTRLSTKSVPQALSTAVTAKSEESPLGSADEISDSSFLSNPEEALQPQQLDTDFARYSMPANALPSGLRPKAPDGTPMRPTSLIGFGRKADLRGLVGQPAAPGGTAPQQSSRPVKKILSVLRPKKTKAEKAHVTFHDENPSTEDQPPAKRPRSSAAPLKAVSNFAKETASSKMKSSRSEPDFSTVLANPIPAIHFPRPSTATAADPAKTFKQKIVGLAKTAVPAKKAEASALSASTPRLPINYPAQANDPRSSRAQSYAPTTPRGITASGAVTPRNVQSQTQTQSQAKAWK